MRRRAIGIWIKSALVIVAVSAAALASFAIPVQSWRTGEVETASLRVTRSDAQVPMRIWIDTDGACGHTPHTDPDDCLALFRIAHATEIEIAGISTIFGNAELNVTDRTVRELAYRLGADGNLLPAIARGAAAPSMAASRATFSLTKALRAGPLTILALGPLTNISALLKSDPKLGANVERVVAVMGRRPGHLFHPSEGKGDGLLFGHGPVFSDLNFRKDPAAVRYLLSTEVPLTLIPYEVARKVLFTPVDIERLASMGPTGSWIASGARGWMEFWKTEVGLDGFYPFDLVAAHFLLAPSDFLCAQANARAESGWAPEWLWPIDNAGLLVTPEEGQGEGRPVKYCPSLSTDEPAVKRMLSLGTTVGNLLRGR